MPRYVRHCVQQANWQKGFAVQILPRSPLRQSAPPLGTIGLKENNNKMKRLLLLLLTLATLTTVTAQVKVKGYYRKDGTYVHPHYRSNPDGNPYNNWSYPGNTNPYTGKTATGNPDTYLKNYYDKSSKSTSDVWVDGYYKSDGTYVPGHFRSNPDGNPYNNWSYPGNTNPYTGKTATGNPDTYLKNYYNNSSSGTIFYHPELEEPEKPLVNLGGSFPYVHPVNISFSSKYYVTANKLNVRSGPSTNYSVKTTLDYGTSITVVDNSNESWAKIEYSAYDYNSWGYKTQTGYVSKSYISSQNPYFKSTYSNTYDDIDLSKYLENYNTYNKTTY
ncbi:SH3 domain-containing protein [Thermoflavifilum thermophilum]|nr:SH3 domain-containing protein [Thermoflavifilum thermophilum]